MKHVRVLLCSGLLLVVSVLAAGTRALAITSTEADCPGASVFIVSGLCLVSIGPLGIGERAALTVNLPDAPCFPAVPNGARITDGVQGYDAVTPPGLWVVNSGRGADRQPDGYATRARLYFHVANDGDQTVQNATVAFIWRCGL